MQIRNLINANGNSVKNQFVIEDGNTVFFQSYDSMICRVDHSGGMGFDKVVTFGKDWNFSKTTSKHLFTFLNQQGLEILANKKAIEEAIERGHARLNESIAVWLDETL